MATKIIEGDRFKSPFTETVFQVKKIYMTSVLLEEIENENRQVITEMGTIASLYEKVDIQ